MAKTIALEFTDAQWELIKDNYEAHDSSGSIIDCTEETFAAEMVKYISTRVTSIMANKAAEANQNAFDV
tara:strand:+ start:960 stop:1166 length:207 start_codon:yes stop_codon:yes gene_type:complete